MTLSLCLAAIIGTFFSAAAHASDKCVEIFENPRSVAHLPFELQQRDVGFEDLFAGFQAGFYSNGAFKFESIYTDLKYPKDFPPKTTVGNIADPEGNLFLFRGIAGEYRRTSIEGPFIKGQGNKYSYSLSPAMALRWIKGAIPPIGYEQIYRRQKYILISLQNFRRDNLSYNFNRRYRDGIDPTPSEGTGLILSAEKGGFRSATSTMDLVADTPIEKTGWFAEVRVPIHQERVFGLVPAEDFEAIINQYGGLPFNQKEFLESLIGLKSFRLMLKQDSHNN